QENKSLVNQFKVSYNIVSLEFAYEHPLNKKLTLEGAVGLGAGNYIEKNIFNENRIGSSLSFQSFPSIRLRSKLKYIYNREKRFNKNKNIDYNSGNYIGIQSTFTSKQNNVTDITNVANNVLLTEIHWGMQRSLGGKWLFNVNGGFGYANDFISKLGKFYPSIGLEFSYVIF
ncbi:MAG TPA: hypothetical protein DDY16_06745, partial [Tenacibaculum sp.]|nr:hypothetical protein [Tenacibaculum sp.]